VESDLHRALKRAALAWLQAAGASAAAHEVRTAIPFWRADVAGWMEGDESSPEQVVSLPRTEIERACTRAGAEAEVSLFDAPSSEPLDALLQRMGAVDLFGNPDRTPQAAMIRRCMRTVRTVLIECKASRADFLSDRADLADAAETHGRLQRRRDRIREQLLPRWEPHLRRDGETLFRETDGWDASRSRLASVRQADRDERLARETLASQVKFDRLAHWRLADRLYLCTPGGMLKASELPAKWGWIEITRGALRVRRAATPLHSPEPRRWRTVGNIRRAEARP
jgi:hypothetical protein